MPADSPYTVGISEQPGFPWEPYEAVHSLLKNLQMSRAKREWAAGWNAVPLRFRACSDYDEAFRSIVGRYPDRNWSAEDRYQLGQHLFGLFVSGLSAIESCLYAAYAVGAYAGLDGFRLDEPEDRKYANPRNIIQAFAGQNLVKGAATFHEVARSVTATAQFKAWSINRNTLTHRQEAPATITLRFGDQWSADYAWKDLDLGETIDFTEAATRCRVEWLRGVIEQLVRATLEFTSSVAERLPQATQ